MTKHGTSGDDGGITGTVMKYLMATLTKANKKPMQEQQRDSNMAGSFESLQTKRNLLTKGAIDKMLRAQPFDGPLTVAVHTMFAFGDPVSSTNKTAQTSTRATIFDDQHIAEALFHRGLQVEKKTKGPTEGYIRIRIKAYVTSLGNSRPLETNTNDSYFRVPTYDTKPFLYITAYEYLDDIESTELCMSQKTAHSYWEVPKMKNENNATINASLDEADDIPKTDRDIIKRSVAFLERSKEELSYDDLAGRNMHQIGVSAKISEDQSMFTKLLTYRKALESVIVNGIDATNSPSQQFASLQHDMHEASLKEFTKSSLQRESDTMQLESSTRDIFLQQQMPPSTKWNSLEELLHARKPVWDAIIHLKKGAQVFNRNDIFPATERTTENVTAWVVDCVNVYLSLLGEDPIHPNRAEHQEAFARWMANQSLMGSSGCPLFLNLLGRNSPAEKDEYGLAMWNTLRNLNVVYRSGEDDCLDTTEQDTLLCTATVQSGLLHPFVSLLFRRGAIASREIFQSVAQKEHAYLDLLRTEAASNVRKEAKTESCLICFGDSPNLMTLCCGKSAHWDCMNKWLTKNHTCPQCRHSMPAKLTASTRSRNDQNIHPLSGRRTVSTLRVNQVQAQSSLDSSMQELLAHAARFQNHAAQWQQYAIRQQAERARLLSEE